MSEVYLEKVATLLDNVANYVEKLEREEYVQTKKVAAEQEKIKLETEKKRKEAAEKILGKISDEAVKKAFENASPEMLAAVDKLVEKNSAVNDDWGNMEQTKSAKTNEYRDPLEAFVLS